MNRMMMIGGACSALLCAASVQAQLRGPSTSQDPYILPSSTTSGVVTISIASNGNGTSAPNETFTRTTTGANDYRLVGIPDGMGAYQTAADIAAGRFVLLCNHELGATSGIVRRHGNRGAFVSSWIINADPADLRVLSADDMHTTFNLWVSGAYSAFDTTNPMPAYTGTLAPPPAVAPFNGIGRFCSADLAEPGAYRFGSLGTDARILLNGEEIGASGRAFAHVATGPEAGVSYELPYYSKYSWENAVASPFPQQKTVVIGLDDSTPGGIYIHVGTKQASGNEIQKAGLDNAQLLGIVVAGVSITAGQPVEDRVWGLGTSTTGFIGSKPFTTYDFGTTPSLTGAQLQSIGDANGVINWLRPEDGCWDTRDPRKFYFVTTDTFAGNSRIWELEFTDITQPELGGVVTMLGDGSVPGSFAGGIRSATGLTDVRMMDNIGMSRYNQIVIQEDVGNNPRLGRQWLYDIARDRITEITISAADRFTLGRPGFLTQDEEASGAIDVTGILGRGWWAINMQSHYGISGELAEGGQLLAMYVPKTVSWLGDVNCDEVVNFDDIDGFVLALTGRAAYEAAYPGCEFMLADANDDEVVNFDDISTFVDCIVSGACP